jgi:hypothetical protein
MISVFATLCTLAFLSPNAQLGSSAVLLDEYAPCGQTSLYLICRLRSLDVSFKEIEELTGPADENGYHSFADLSRAAERLGLRPMALRVDRARLMALPMPAIVHVEYAREGTQRHLSVLLSTSPEGAMVLDPPYPASLVPWSRFDFFSTGNVLVFPSSDEEVAAIDSLLRESTHSQLWLVNLALGVVSIIGISGCFAVLWRHNPRVRGSNTILPRLGAEQIVSPSASKDELEPIPLRRGRFRIAIWCLSLAVATGLASLVGMAFSAGLEIFSNVPRLVIDKPLVDLGEFAPGEYETTVTLHNKGRQELEISKVESSCSCAVVTKPDVIPPYSSAPMKVTFFVSPGTGFANLAIRSSDPRGLEDLTLQWHGSAKPMLLPRRIAADDVPLGSTYERVVSFVYPGGRSAVTPSLRSVESDSDKVKLVVIKNDSMAFRTMTDTLQSEAVGYLDTRLTVDSPDKAGTIATTCVVTVRYGEHDYTLKLPVTVRFRERITAEPENAVFSAVGAKEFVNQARSIRLIGLEALDELKIAKSPEWLTCELVKSAESEFELRMIATKAPSESLSRDSVELSSTVDSPLRLSIGVAAFVGAGAPPLSSD